MPVIVNMFWHGSVLPPYAGFCMRSFIDRGHTIRLFTYGPLELPTGVMRADAGCILNSDELPRYHSIAAFSDAFRYELLLKEGGWWVDVDVVCLTDTLPEASYAWAEQEPGVVNGAILKFPKGDAILAQLAAAARELSSRTKWGAIGPSLMSSVLHGCNPLDRAGSTSEFYPLHWLEAPQFLLPEHKSDILRRIEHSMFLHLWSHVFEEIGIDLHRECPRGSLMYDFVQPSSENQATLWTQLKTRRAIRKYLRQSWVRDRWSQASRSAGSKPLSVRYRPF